jgi:hypothetical protein
LYLLLQDIFKAIDIIVSEKLRKLRFDYTIEGCITGINDDGSYKVKINGQNSNIKARDWLSLNIGEIVYIKVVNGNYSFKFIDCKRMI